MERLQKWLCVRLSGNGKGLQVSKIDGCYNGDVTSKMIPIMSSSSLLQTTPTKPKRYSAEWRQKISEAQKGNTYAKGSTRSEKHKQVLRDYKLAKKETDVTKIKKSLSHAGLKESEDTKDKKKIKRIRYWRKKNGFASM
jgi:hypothetical protein